MNNVPIVIGYYLDLYMPRGFDELFYIGFIEHLTVLDFEGNNLKDQDQLYYLKRCRKLTHLNLKYNPVTSNRIEYYNQIKDNCPLIEELDDEVV